MSVSRVATIGALAACAWACARSGSDAGGASAAPSLASSRTLIEAPDDDEDGAAGSSAQRKGEAAKAGERVAVAAGALIAGSTPGDRGRDPVLEPALLRVELAAFEIDRLPYPNDPAREPLTGVARPRAAELCAQAGGRLCTELEWERACKGPEQLDYAGGERWDPACAAGASGCASSFGVLAMGAALREWTSSDVQPVKKLQPRAAAVRGAAADAADVDHRCGHRSAVSFDAETSDLGFRCCRGEPNAPTIASPDWQPAFRAAEMPSARLEELLATSKRLIAVSNDIKYFREEAAIETVRRRGEGRGADAGALPNTRMTTAPTLWDPVPGEEILLVTGQSGKDSFIVAFHRLPDDRYRVGAALIMKDELGPVVLIYNPYVRRKLHWATCWECYGETGNITYREENRVVITQK